MALQWLASVHHGCASSYGVSVASFGVHARQKLQERHLQCEQCSATEHQSSHPSHAMSSTTVDVHGLHSEQARHLQNAQCLPTQPRVWRTLTTRSSERELRQARGHARFSEARVRTMDICTSHRT